MSSKRGKCPRCGYSIRLRKDGTLGGHRVRWITWRFAICPGGGQAADTTEAG